MCTTLVLYSRLEGYQVGVVSLGTGVPHSGKFSYGANYAYFVCRSATAKKRYCEVLNGR